MGYKSRATFHSEEGQSLNNKAAQGQSLNNKAAQPQPWLILSVPPPRVWIHLGNEVQYQKAKVLRVA